MLLAIAAGARRTNGAAGGRGVEAATDVMPVDLLVIGIVSVLGMIIGLKLNAFLALIISALIVSLLVGLCRRTRTWAAA